MNENFVVVSSNGVIFGTYSECDAKKVKQRLDSEESNNYPITTFKVVMLEYYPI